MSSFELNKITGAILAALLLAVGLDVLSVEIFSRPKLAAAGYDLPASEPARNKTATPVAAPLADRLARADPGKGETDTKPCRSCHSFDKDGSAKLGPPLYGVVERQIASVKDFAYSHELKAKSGNWTFEQLDRFLTDPKAFASGTKMTFAGERDPAKRAEIILYLDKLSEHPTPLPGKSAMQ